MTKINNYPTNTVRPNLELSIYWDTYQSQVDFDENFKRIGNSDHLFLYTDFGNLPEDLPEPVKISNDASNRAALECFLEDGWDDLDDWSLDDLVDQVESEADITESDFFDFLDEAQVNYTRPYEIISTQGYSQGDYAEVIIPTGAIKEVWGGAPTEAGWDELQETINHLFWDAPLYFHLTINEEEYFDSDFWYAQYEYFKDDFIQAFMSKYRHTLPDPDYIEEWLKENLPVDPEYLQ